MSFYEDNCSRRRAMMMLAAAGVAPVCAPAASAPAYPEKAVTIITGYGVGSGGDLATRLVAEQLGRQLGHPFIVQTRPGAGNILAARAVKDAPPDGYTLLAGNPSVFSGVFLKKPLEAAKELAPVGEFSRGDVFLFTSKAASVKELMDIGRSSPVRFGSINAGTAMMIAMVAEAMKIKYEIIPFRTSEQIAQALVADDVQAVFRTAGTYFQLVDIGKIHLIGTLSGTRSPFAPTVPTLDELGIKVVVSVANGLWAPLGTPAHVVATINAELKRALTAQLVVDGLRNAFQYPYHSTPTVQVENLRRENEFYAKGAAMTGYAPL